MAFLRSTAIILICLVGLIVLWTQLSDNPEATKQSQPSTRQPLKSEAVSTTSLLRIEALETELLNTTSTLHQLELRLQQLEQKLANHNQPVQQLENSNTANSPPAQAQREASTKSLQERLLESGFPLDTVERIRQRLAQNRLAQLTLRDQATRENWIDTPEYLEKIEQLNSPAQSLREELGDSDYDRYLYAAGRPNRVIVTEVFTGSAAADAGILPGDVIISYASELIFSMSDLQQATVQGNSGEYVLLEILRENNPLSTSVPRGPLGIAMTITRKPPA